MRLLRLDGLVHRACANSHHQPASLHEAVDGIMPATRGTPSAVLVEEAPRGIPMARRSPCQHLNLVSWGYICQFASSCSGVVHVSVLCCTFTLCICTVVENVPLMIIYDPLYAITLSPIIVVEH